MNKKFTSGLRASKTMAWMKASCTSPCNSRARNLRKATCSFPQPVKVSPWKENDKRIWYDLSCENICYLPFPFLAQIKIVSGEATQEWTIQSLSQLSLLVSSLEERLGTSVPPYYATWCTYKHRSHVKHVAHNSERRTKVLSLLYNEIKWSLTNQKACVSLSIL